MSADASPTQPIVFLRAPQVCLKTGRSKRQLYRMVAADEFPPSHRQSHKVAVWYGHEVEAWLIWRMAVDAGKRIASWRDCLPEGLRA